MHVAKSILCFLFQYCSETPPNHENVYGITDRYISVEGTTPGADGCYKSPDCDGTSKYRQLDGSCNNLDNPRWASAETTYQRLLPAEYHDGLQEIRKAKDGNELPNVRKISTTIYPDIYDPDLKNSLALMQWGQVLTHDAGSTGFPLVLNCCPNGKFPDQPVAQCNPISVPKDDPFYSRYGVTCMDYNRVDTTASVQNCSLKPQQQISYVTQWLDMSLLYGINDEVGKSIRELQGGRLKVQVVDGEELLPITHEPQDFCRITSSNQSCLNTGDIRVNQNPDIALMTVVFMKEHNRLAKELSKVNPNWNDEKLYQEARRINIAQVQHITYHEYLPHILGQMYIDGLKLGALTSGFTEYDSKIRGGTFNEFTNSVFRTFHSTVQGDLKLVGRKRKGCPMTAKLGDLWWTSGDLVISCFEQIAKGLMVQEARTYNNYVTVQETEYYLKGNKSYGDDLESVDLMRGRDVGVPSYNKYRKICGLSSFSSFEELNTALKPHMAHTLSKLYGDVNDIDLYIGVILEKPVSIGLSGPTGQCIMAQQFARWKYGDRFYYEHGEQTGSFSMEQLDSIRKFTFSSLMCQNTKIGRIQKNGFYRASPTNTIISCDQVPTVDLKAWKE